MGSRVEVTTKYAKAYAKASKKDKGRVLDPVVEVTGWSRDNSRRRLVGADPRTSSAREVDHQTRTAAAQLDHDPQGRRRGRGRARVLRIKVPPDRGNLSRAFLPEARSTSRGHLDVRHCTCQ